MTDFRSKLGGLLLATMLITFSLPAAAMTISGALTFSGDFQPVGGTGLDNATGIDFLGDDFDVDDASGDFAAAGITQGDFGTINDFTFVPFVSVTPLWQISGFSFDLTSFNIEVQTTDFLVLTGMGTISGNGFDPTSGSWILTGNRAGTLFNFSAGSAVPVPGAFLLFGSALAGLGWVRRRS